MINILMVGPERKAKGGVATVVNNYYDSSLIKKVRLKYISTAIDGKKIYKLLYGSFSYLKILYTLIFKRVDILHIHMASRNSFNRKSVIVNMAKMFNKKVIIHLHGAEFDKFYNNECTEMQKKKVNKIFNKADIIIALSEQWKEKISNYCDTQVEVIYNSVVVPKENMYSNNSQNITLLGRLEKRKGIFDLLDIVKDVVEEKPEINFLLGGDGSLEKIRDIISQNNIANNAKLLGWVDAGKKDNVLKQTLIYVLPSYDEGMPMSLLEAMSYGIPVIATDVGGIPRVIENNVNGFLIKPGDKEDLKKCILKLIKNDEIRENISKKGYNTIKQTFSIEAHVEKLIFIYEGLMKKDHNS